MLRNAQRSEREREDERVREWEREWERERGWDELFSVSLFCVTLLIGWREQQPISLKKMLEHILLSNHDIDILLFTLLSRDYLTTFSTVMSSKNHICLFFWIFLMTIERWNSRASFFLYLGRKGPSQTLLRHLRILKEIRNTKSTDTKIKELYFWQIPFLPNAMIGDAVDRLLNELKL